MPGRCFSGVWMVALVLWGCGDDGAPSPEPTLPDADIQEDVAPEDVPTPEPTPTPDVAAPDVVDNRAPKVFNAQIALREDSQAQFRLQGNDPDGDPLIFEIIAPPEHGALEGVPPNLTYTPNTDYNGVDRVLFQASDGQLDSGPATVTFEIAPVNDAPVALPRAVMVEEDSAQTFGLVGSDPEGAPLTVRVLTTPEHGDIERVDNSVIYRPDPDYFGPDSLTYDVDDGELSSPAVTVSITVVPVNDPPEFTSMPQELERGVVGRRFVFETAALDVESDPEELTFGDLDGPFFLSLVDQGDGTATIEGTPTSSNGHEVSFRVFDPDGGSAAQSFRLSITPPPVILRLEVSGTGSGVISSLPEMLQCVTTCDIPLEPGSPVILVAMPSPGSRFAGWRGSCFGVADCILEMDADRTVTAIFDLIP